MWQFELRKAFTLGKLITIDSAVGSVSSSASLLGSVDLRVLDDEFVSVQSLHLGVGCQVLEE